MRRPGVTRGQRALIVVVVAGVAVIASIGFVGSYTAVQHLAVREGFGWFSYALPVGVDAGITVFLALDLLLTWMRMPMAMLRHLAWLLTAATIVFNAASAWPRPLATGMHAVVPILFVAAIEAARHTVGRITQFDADQFMEGTRLGRWILAPVATFRLWRRRQLWELRSNAEAIEMERRRLVFRARLRAEYGRGWRRKAPVDLRLVLKLANLGEPLPKFQLDVSHLDSTLTVTLPGPGRTPEPALMPAPLPARAEITTAAAAEETATGTGATEQPVPDSDPAPQEPAALDSSALVDDTTEEDTVSGTAAIPAQQSDSPRADREPPSAPEPAAVTAADRYYQAFCDYCTKYEAYPDGEQLAQWLHEEAGISGRSGSALSAAGLRRYLPNFRERWQHEREGSAVPTV